MGDVTEFQKNVQKSKKKISENMGDTEIVNLYDTLESWANKENRDLHAEIQNDQLELQTIKSDCTELQERVNILKEHLQNVQVEVSKTQELLTAKNQQVEDERHQTQIVLREKGKIDSDLQKISDQIINVGVLREKVENKIVIAQTQVEQFREEARMNEDELEQWITIARQKEEDFLVLQRYQREDEGRVRSMLLEIEKSTGIIEAKKKELEQEVTATRALQIELDMTAEQFRKMHDERKLLLDQWEATMQQMQQLNNRIEDKTNEFDGRKTEVDKLHKNVVEERKNLDVAESENQRTERQLTIGDHKVSLMHKQFEQDSHDLAEFGETVETQRHQLDKLESDERAYKEEIQKFKDMTAKEIEKKEFYIKRLQDTEDALSTQTDLSKDINEQTDILNDFLKKQEVALKTLENSIDAGKQSIYKLSQEVSSVKKKQKDLRAEMEGSQTRAKNLQLKIQEFDRETQKQMELLYNSNFQIQQMERKIARIEGERTEEEKIELQAQIDQLSEKLEKKLEIEKVLSLQLHRLELDLRQSSRKKDELNNAHADLESKLNEIRLDQDSLDKSTVKSRTQKENVLVQLNMLRLQVEKLTEQVNIKSNELISLENRRQQLQLSMEERLLEIDEHIAALKTQLKTEEEARHMAGLELKEREKRAQTLESKYQIMMGKYQVEGEEVTQSYHIMKFTKEREEIAKKGDMLNEQVKKAAKELQQLEKAMNRLNNNNTKFRRAFTSVDESDQDMERKKVLEEQVRVAQQRLNARKAQANSISQEKREREQTYTKQEEIIEKIQMNISKLRPVVDKVANENTEIKEKINRVQKLISKARERHRTENNIPTTSKYPSSLLEMDIELRMEKGNIEMTVSDLVRLAGTNAEIIPKLRLAFTQIGIPLKTLQSLQGNERQVPSLIPRKGGAHIITPSSASNSRPSSYRSSASSIRSGSASSNRSITSNRSTSSKGSAYSRGSRRGTAASVKQITIV